MDKLNISDNGNSWTAQSVRTFTDSAAFLVFTCLKALLILCSEVIQELLLALFLLVGCKWPQNEQKIFLAHLVDMRGTVDWTAEQICELIVSWIALCISCIVVMHGFWMGNY